MCSRSAVQEQGSRCRTHKQYTLMSGHGHAMTGRGAHKKLLAATQSSAMTGDLL